MIHEKEVVRFEAVCDGCGEYLGEFASKVDARHALTQHFRITNHQEAT